MKKLAIGVLAATMLIAACGGSSSKSSDSPTTTGDKSTSTTAGGGGGGGGGGDDNFSALAAQAKTANYKATYTTDGDSELTLAQDGEGKSRYQSGDSLIINDGTTTIQCDGTTSSAKCTDLGKAGAGIASAATALFTGAYAGIAALNSSAFGGDTSSETIAGRDATCVTLDASNAGALAGAIGKLAGNPSLTTCVDKETGVLLKYSAKSDSSEKTVFEATEFSESSPSDFEPPSTPVPGPTIPNITLPGGITIPSIPGVNG